MDLEKYLAKNGISKKAFAKQLGIHYHALLHAFKMRRSIPFKYFDDIVRLTGGKVTMHDLENHLRAYIFREKS